MTEQELRQLRRAKWRLSAEAAERPVRTLEDAQEFIESVGFATLYPMKPTLLAPTFLGAYVGDDANLPTWQHGYSDTRAQEALPLMVRLLRSKGAYEANLFGESSFLVSASAFPYFYALVGDKNPKHDPKKFSTTKTSPLANDIFKLIQEKGALTKQKMQEQLGGAPSNVAIDRALHELWTPLKITRVDNVPGQGSSWDAMYRWSRRRRRSVHWCQNIWTRWWPRSRARWKTFSRTSPRARRLATLSTRCWRHARSAS